jgi:RNA polymerase sigma factor (TIGR02999 family)
MNALEEEFGRRGIKPKSAADRLTPMSRVAQPGAPRNIAHSFVSQRTFYICCLHRLVSPCTGGRPLPGGARIGTPYDHNEIMHRPDELTALLSELPGGGRDVFDRLVPLVYDELRRIARRRLRDERYDHTLTTTALVHEAYLDLANAGRIALTDRAHFFAVATRAMRRILVDHAVRRRAQKRGGAPERVALDDVVLPVVERDDDVLSLEEALQRLEAAHARHARVVECRFFGGLSIDETADVLGVSPATVKREWTMARAWLNRELRAE